MAKRMLPLCLLLTLNLPAAMAGTPFRVMIDPGHGGQDYGATFRESRNGNILVSEKEVTLALAQETARQLRARGYSVILTREFDQDIPLPKRTAMANKAKADVFISIHMNSKPGAGGAEGVETFILDNATDATSKRLAQLENSVLSGGANAALTASSEPNDLALILKDLQLDANLSQSKRLACSIQSNLVSFRNRGVKQALFYVLLGADMPSVLLEAGFLNHPKDRAKVLSTAGRKQIALGVARALDDFRKAKASQTALNRLSRCKVN
jgi:N-acetylmuramoyl-L-alanine amidase